MNYGVVLDVYSVRFTGDYGVLIDRWSLTYRLQKNIYLASSATPPGAGVHGVPGWLAVGEVLKDYKT